MNNERLIIILLAILIFSLLGIAVYMDKLGADQKHELEMKKLELLQNK